MLPLGNGRLGMMTSGDIDSEMLILNEISLWSGCERDYANPDAAESLPQIRELLMAGDNVKAQEVMYERFVPHKAVDEQSYGSYQVLAGLVLDYDYPTDSLQPPSGYHRWLNLKDATSYTDFELNGVNYTRKYYVDRVRDVMVVEIATPRSDASRTGHFLFLDY
jgi:alpha-L-fucosidase 2